MRLAPKKTQDHDTNRIFSVQDEDEEDDVIFLCLIENLGGTY